MGEELLERIPIIDGKKVKEFQDRLSAEVNQGMNMPKWLNNNLTYLKNNNTSLYDQIISRSQMLATAMLHYSSTQNQDSIIMSMTMEYIVFLMMIATALPNKERENFKGMLENWGFSEEDFNK